MTKKKITIDDSPPEIDIKEADLLSAKYTQTGIQRYKQTIEKYGEQLFKIATLLGEKDKRDGFDREITEQHVRNAAIEMNKSLTKTEKPMWIVFCQIGEYLCTAGVGVGGSNLETKWGICTFGLGLTIGIALFITRMTKTKQ